MLTHFLGTVSTVSQMAKDVVTYLAYCAKPEEEDRKKMGVKVVASLLVLACMSYAYKRFRWNVLKTRRLKYQ